LNLGSWIGLTVLVLLVPPNSFLLVFFGFFLLFSGLFLTGFLVLKSWLNSAFLGAYICSLLDLQIFDQLHILNLILITAFFIVFWLEIRKKNKKTFSGRLDNN